MINKALVYRILLLACTSIFITGVSAQSDKIRQAIDDGNLKRALKLAEDSEVDSEFKKDPEVYYLKAEVIYELMKDPYYLNKNPESLKIGLKALEKGKSRANGVSLPAYSSVVDHYVELNDLMAQNDYKVNRYNQAISAYLKSYELNGNKSSYAWAGKCYMASTDSVAGEKIYNEVIFWCNEQQANGKKIDKQFEEPYMYFADKHWQNKQFDSADVYLLAARKIWGGNAKLDYYQMEIAKQRVDLLPPSNLMMEVIQKTLSYFPTDTFFIKKENALYLFLMRTYLDNKDTIKFDTLLNTFAVQKIERNSSKNVAVFKEYDQFLDSKKENVYWKLVAYFNKFNHLPVSNFICDKYIKLTANSLSVEDIRKRYLVIIDYAAKSKSLDLATQILNYAVKKYGENPEYTAIQNSLISQNLKKPLPTADQGALYRLMLIKEPNLAKISDDFQIITINYVDGLIKEKQYIKAKGILLTHQKAQAINPIWDKKLKVIAKEDFYHNYYQTRIKDEEVAGTMIPGFEWNGDPLQCFEGDLNLETQMKVQNRVNYFRRQNGLNEIFLDEQLNLWCQKAALMMEVNKMMNHSPRANWSCFTDEGAEACKYSLLIKGSNTTMAVTSLFADNKNPSVGNRRWILYPNAKALGHGSTTNYCALWALDDSGNVDTNMYKEKFIAWPPEGIIPRMMVFDYWSFSLKQDLKDATISVSENGNPIAIEVLPQVAGYGLPTVVWKIKSEINNLPTDQEFTVTVTLKNGRKYVYNVYMMDFDPVGY